MEKEETQETLNIGIGTKEAEKLKPVKVKIVKVEIQKLGDLKSEKLKCLCQHPDKDEPIQISEVKYERNKKLDVIGLWVNKDEDGLIRKGSATAVFLEYMKASTPAELEGKECDTTKDDSGFLCFKAY